MSDGGSVFPISGSYHQACIQPGEGCRILPGMSLRDYFAGQALAGLMLREAYTSPENRAGVAYEFADAMLAAREKSR